jgi:hypothetical protein
MKEKIHTDLPQLLTWLSSADPGQERLRNVSYTLCPLPSPSLSCRLHVGLMCRFSSTSRHRSLPPSSDMVYRPAATAAAVRMPPSEREGQILDDRCPSSLHGCRPPCLRQLRAWELELRREQGAASLAPAAGARARAQAAGWRSPAGHGPRGASFGLHTAGPGNGGGGIEADARVDLAAEELTPRPAVELTARAMVLAPAHQRRSCRAQWPSWPAVAMGRKGEGRKKARGK